jgi:hypothetical protein
MYSKPNNPTTPIPIVAEKWAGTPARLDISFAASVVATSVAVNGNAASPPLM